MAMVTGPLCPMNGECNGWDRIWTSTEGWKWTQPLNADDVVVNA